MLTMFTLFWHVLQIGAVQVGQKITSVSSRATLRAALERGDPFIMVVDHIRVGGLELEKNFHHYDLFDLVDAPSPVTLWVRLHTFSQHLHHAHTMPPTSHSLEIETTWNIDIQRILYTILPKRVFRLLYAYRTLA